MFENGVRRAGLRVIADEDGRTERRVDPLHHVLRSRAGAANQHHTGTVHVSRQQVGLVTMRVAHHELAGAGGKRAVDRGIGFGGHDGAEVRVVAACRAHVGPRHNSGESLHVDGNEDLQRRLLRTERRNDGNGRQTERYRCQCESVHEGPVASAV